MLCHYSLLQFFVKTTFKESWFLLFTFNLIYQSKYIVWWCVLVKANMNLSFFFDFADFLLFDRTLKSIAYIIIINKYTLNILFYNWCKRNMNLFQNFALWSFFFNFFNYITCIFSEIKSRYVNLWSGDIDISLCIMVWAFTLF